MLLKPYRLHFTGFLFEAIRNAVNYGNLIRLISSVISEHL